MEKGQQAGSQSDESPRVNEDQFTSEANSEMCPISLPQKFLTRITIRNKRKKHSLSVENMNNAPSRPTESRKSLSTIIL